jgi:hypothetical protein
MHKSLVKHQQRRARARRFAGGWTVFVPPNRTLGIGNTAAAAWKAAAVSLATKSRTSVRSRIDQMIDWHETNKTACPAIRVQATANTVRKFARKRRGQFRYRNQIIVPIRSTRTRAEIAAANASGSTTNL